MTEPNFIPLRRGYFFEEFAVGQVFTSPGRTVTETDLVNFAGFTGDWTPIHTDVVHAAQHPFGQRVAHGMLGLSIASGLVIRLGLLEETILAFREILDWKFSQPVTIGDTVHVRATIMEKRIVRRAGGGLVTVQVELLNQKDQVVQHGLWSVLVKGQEAPGQ